MDGKENIFNEMEYQTGKTYADLLWEMKDMMTVMDENEYEDLDVLYTAILFGHRKIEREFRNQCMNV